MEYSTKWYAIIDIITIMMVWCHAAQYEHEAVLDYYFTLTEYMLAF